MDIGEECNCHGIDRESSHYDEGLEKVRAVNLCFGVARHVTARARGKLVANMCRAAG